MGEKVKVGILYICTGPYKNFWKSFYDSMDKNLMPETEKTFFVFSDAELYNEDSDNVEKIHIENKPWPLVTLLRFHTFIGIEDRLKKYDYLIFCNANLACNRMVKATEILPGKDENYSFTIHPGYFNKKPRRFVYERRKKSTAYIPYNCGLHYVIGAFFGGKTEPFLAMCHSLADSIEEDLKRNIIARWHDESQINRYIIGRKDVRLLSPSYCYPCGFEIDYENVIYALDKKSVFDIDKFKGYQDEKVNKKTIGYQIKRVRAQLDGLITSWWGWVRDTVMRKRIR